MNALAIFLAIAAAIFWALTQVLTKTGLQRMDLISYASFRPLFALLFIVPYGLFVSEFHFVGPNFIGVAILSGIIDPFIGSFLYFFAIKKSSAHETASLANTAPFWGVVTAVLFLGERPRPVVFIAALLVVSGAYFLVTRRVTPSTNHSLWGTLPALGAGVLWGVTETVPAKYCLNQGMSPVSYLLIMVSTAAVSWNLVALFTKNHHFRFNYPWRDIGVAMLTAFTGFFLGWVLWLTGLQMAPASLLAPIRGSMTLFAFLLSIVLLRERPTRRSALGVFLTFGGVFLVSILG